MLDATIESMQLLAEVSVRRMDHAHGPSLLSNPAPPASTISPLVQAAA